MIINPKDILVNIVNEFKDKCTLVAIYGSYSNKSLKEVTKSSDIDFLIVYKEEVNPYLYSSLIDKAFRNLGLKYDYSWYMEDDFISTIENGIDYYFWKEIFNTGEILVGEPTFIKKIHKILNSIDPLIAFQRSIESRRSEILQSLVDIVRDMHVMLSYCLWTKFWLERGKIPTYSELLNNLEESQTITPEVKVLFNKFESLRLAFKSGHMPTIDIIVELFKQVQDIIKEIEAQILKR